MLLSNKQHYTTPIQLFFIKIISHITSWQHFPSILSNHPAKPICATLQTYSKYMEFDK